MKYKILKCLKVLKIICSSITGSNFEYIASFKRYKSDSRIVYKDDYLLLRIQHNGKGFNVYEKLEQSYGLKNMRERAFVNLVQRSILYHCQIQVHVSR